MSNSKEEGEIEEGELPGEFSSHPEEAQKQAEPTALDSERPPNSLVKAEPSSSSLAPYGIYTNYIDGYEQRGSSRYHSGYRERSSSGQQWSRYADYGDRGRGDSYREASDDDLLHDFAKLIAHTGITDAIRNLDDVCKRLESAMEILNRLWKRSERAGRDGVFSSYATHVASLHKALRAVQVASGTGAGKTQNMDKAKSAMKYAWHLRERLFSAAHQKELENWISSSKYFRFILAEEGAERAARSNGTAQGREDRETGEIGQASSDREASAGRGGRQPDAGGSSGGQEGDRPGGWQNGKRLRQDSDLSEPSDSEQQHKHLRHSDRNNQSSRPQPAANGAAAAAPQNGNDSSTDDVAVVNDQSPPPSPPSLLLEAELASLLQTDARDLLKQGKLCLVLDLDHTLLNSARFSELASSTELSLQNRIAHETQTIPAGQRELYRLPKVGMWTKLRPGVREFLQRASEKFELWIHTNGNRQYASAVVEVLDPTKEYFGSRVITGAGSDHMGASALMTKRLMQGLEGREPVVIIVDDSSAVWPHDLRNLLVVERYLYFPPSAPRGASSNSLFELSRDECPHSGMLKTATRVIETVHAGVFRHLTSAPTPPPSPPPPTPLWDVREVLAAEKKKILAGCTIVFTRVIPLNTDPQSNSFWKLAESYGAVCSLQLTDATTHVIAATAGTEKANQARAMRKHVVNLSWLNASCILWQRADEALFTLQD